MCIYLSFPRPNLPMTPKRRNVVPRLPSLSASRARSFSMSDPSPTSRKVRVLLAERNRRQCLGAPSDASQSQGLIASLVTKIVNNLQVTVRNIHVRYEDKLSVPVVTRRTSSIVMMMLMLPFSTHLRPA